MDSNGQRVDSETWLIPTEKARFTRARANGKPAGCDTGAISYTDELGKAKRHYVYGRTRQGCTREAGRSS